MILCLRLPRQGNGEDALGVSRRIPKWYREREERDEVAYNEKQREEGGYGSCRRGWKEDERREREGKRKREKEWNLGRNGRVRRNIPSKTFHSTRE